MGLGTIQNLEGGREVVTYLSVTVTVTASLDLTWRDGTEDLSSTLGSDGGVEPWKEMVEG